ncbi:hypothetical protein NITMOv2_2384 [Nitrospira moscoviensis]|uniref:Uncharacterized protein n=1 Tax=Nitrospira moscoviensis TaxID=42253 RepID=A0A0K2GD57_NITMO|nr:hypothetical protein NITMOv2_2384 [Nitrospira moscoviensis]
MAREMFRGASQEAGERNDRQRARPKHQERVGLQHIEGHRDGDENQQEVQPGCKHVSHTRTVARRTGFVDETPSPAAPLPNPFDYGFALLKTSGALVYTVRLAWETRSTMLCMRRMRSPRDAGSRSLPRSS